MRSAKSSRRRGIWRTAAFVAGGALILRKITPGMVRYLRIERM